MKTLKTLNYDSYLNSSSPKTSTSEDDLHLEGFSSVACIDNGDLPSPPYLEMEPLPSYI